MFCWNSKSKIELLENEFREQILVESRYFQREITQLQDQLIIYEDRHEDDRIRQLVLIRQNSELKSKLMQAQQYTHEITIGGV